MATNIIKRRKENWPGFGQGPLGYMRTGLDRLFDDFFDEFDISPVQRGLTGFAPQVDITEDEKGFNITAELPGLEEKDVEITLDDNILTLKGEKKHEYEDKTKGKYHIERSYGRFERRIALPKDIEEDKISADFKKGVLNIAVPRAPQPEKKFKKIDIKAK